MILDRSRGLFLSCRRQGMDVKQIGTSRARSCGPSRDNNVNMHTQGSREYTELAAFLSKERDAVVQEWISAVRRDRTIPTAENLTVRQLRDHMPEVFDRLAEVLRA